MRALALGVAAAASGLRSATAASVDAGTLTTVVAAAPLYDAKPSDAGGCDPSGCVAGLTRDGDATTLGSRWSCKPDLGTDASCSITYTLADPLDVVGLKVAMYKGDERTRTMDVYVDGVLQTTWTSSGTTTAFENIELAANGGQEVEIRGVLAGSEWISIAEVEILVDDGDDGGETGVVEAGTLGTVTATADRYDENLAATNGCDPEGCTAALTRDGDVTAGSRWSCQGSTGSECRIEYDLGASRDLSELRLAMYKGDTRVRTVEVYVEGVLATTWSSSGTTTDFESIDLSGYSAQYVTLVGVLANSEWLSIVETEIMVLSDGAIPPTLPPSPTPPPATVPPTTAEPVTPTGDLTPVGLLPLAQSSTGTTRRPGMTRETFPLKDGDLSTSWTCTGGPQAADDRYYECYVTFDMFAYRRIKQVNIALADGASGSTSMSIIPAFRAEVDGEKQVFVTSSGTTDGFETYDFDYFTNYVTISAIFTSAGQTISIAEVEFIEEVQPGEVHIKDFVYPSDSEGLWRFDLNSYAVMTTFDLQFPVGDTYKFEMWLYNQDGDANEILTYESADVEGWQSFEGVTGTGLSDYIVTYVEIVNKGTGSGATGFELLDARFIGTVADNPSDTYYVGSTNLEVWGSPRYPDFVAEGTGDQKAIMGAICAVKKASFDGVDCVGGDEAATGTVDINFGEWFVDGTIFMKSGVTLDARYTQDDSPYTTELTLEEGAAGKTDVAALVVMDGISDARVSSLWVNGLYDPESGNADAAVSGLGSLGVSIVGSQNITLFDTEVNFIDGDAVVVRDSEIVNIDSGPYDEQYVPWEIAQSRGTGILVDSSDSVWVRRYAVADNGVAGIHIMGSNNFTFEATIADQCYGDSCVLEGEGRVGSLDGQQLIEVIVESSTLVQFQDMRVLSVNDPVMTISESTGVSFNNCGFSSVASGTCVIQTDGLSEVTTAEDPELTLDGTCYVKAELRV